MEKADRPALLPEPAQPQAWSRHEAEAAFAEPLGRPRIRHVLDELGGHWERCRDDWPPGSEVLVHLQRVEAARELGDAMRDQANVERLEICAHAPVRSNT